MDKDYLGISDVDLGTLKSAFLTPNRENVLYTGTLDTREVATYIYEISKLSKEERLNIIKNKLNEIYLGKIFDEEELNRQESYIVLLLKSIPFEKKEADTYWKNRLDSGRHENTSNVLIEVAAIHPLVEGKPGREFQEHLDQAIKLYTIEKEKGNNPIIYIPGSLHCIIDRETNTPKVDSQPLSEAGKEYLISKGIPEEIIRANVANINIKHEDGVYNSGDECYVATQIAREENCGRILSVVSPVQLYRKALFYQEFGFNPEMYATGSEKTNHNYIGELFWSLYITYMNDQDWQTNFLSYLTRKERDIDYFKKIEPYREIVDKILQNGPGIPENIAEQRKKWQEIFKKAKENMDNADQNRNDILVDLVRTDGKKKFETERILEIVEQYPDTEITLTYDSTTDIDDLKILAKQKALKLRLIPSDDKEPINVAEMFKKGRFKKMFGMYPSSISMKRSIELIKNGVIPIVSTLPEENPNYIDSISTLLQEAMKPIKEKEERV